MVSPIAAPRADPPAPARRCAGRDRPRAPPSAWRARSAPRAAPRRSARPRCRRSASSGVNGRGPTQPSLGPFGLGATASSWTGPAAQALRASGGRLRPAGLPPRRREPAGQEPQRLDHLAALGPPQPGAPGDERVRRGQRQGAAGERHAIFDQARAEVGQKLVGRRRFGRRVNQPGERRETAPWADHRLDTVPLSSALRCLRRRLASSEENPMDESARRPPRDPDRGPARHRIRLPDRSAKRS